MPLKICLYENSDNFAIDTSSLQMFIKKKSVIDLPNLFFLY